MKKIKRQIITLGIFIGLAAIFLASQQIFAPKKTYTWSFQSIDTMKYSRDLAREKLNDPTFDQIIRSQVKEIASTGATHVAIATPYDEEFYPILKRWVDAARVNNLHVWFRGNFSGWEGWFDYPKITREVHLQKTVSFIQSNGNLFRDEDVFSACPECENGGPGDPRFTGDIQGHRKFLIDEYVLTKKAFADLGLSVASNYNSMNYDVAKVVMDYPTTEKLDGVVAIDHYVKAPEKLDEDVNNLAKQSGGKILLGEFGAPIPDIHGNMSAIEQSEWIEQTLHLISQNSNLVGINYWVGVGGSTELWDASGKERAAVAIIRKYYKLR